MPGDTDHNKEDQPFTGIRPDRKAESEGKTSPQRNFAKEDPDTILF